MFNAATVPTVTPHLLARRAGAVLAGLVAIFLVTTATDVLLYLAGVLRPKGNPPMSNGLFLLAFTYRAIYGIAGSWLTARLAPTRPMQHALALGAIGFALSIAGAIALWDAGPGWYSIGVAASALPCAYLGGRLNTRRKWLALRQRA